MYGGVSGKHIESVLWSYNITTDHWSSREYNVSHAMAGHSAVLIDSKMYIIFGHSPVYGYMNKVQVMDLGRCLWWGVCLNIDKNANTTYLRYTGTCAITESAMLDVLCIQINKIEN